MKDYKVIIEEWDDGYQAKREYFGENEFEINEPTKAKVLEALEEYILSCHNTQEEIVSDLDFLKSNMPFSANGPYIKRYRQRKPKTDFVISLNGRDGVYWAEIQYNRIICCGDGNSEDEAIKSLSEHINNQYNYEVKCLKVFRDFIKKNIPLKENSDCIINKRIKGSLKDYQLYFDV